MTKEKKSYLIIAILAIVGWHVVISSSGTKKINGPFSAVPKPGYTWSDGSNDSRFFWNGMKSQWQPGTIHPSYKAVSYYTKDEWLPLPGYLFGIY